MKTLIFCLIAITASSLVSAAVEGDDHEDHSYKPLLPCPGCIYHFDPVCGVSTETGKHKTFANSCEVKAADCGKSEHRKLK